MFGFIFSQPIYKSLMQMRVIYIAALVVTYLWADELMVEILELSSENASVELVAVYFTNFLALVAMFWKAIGEIRKPLD